MAVGVDQAGQKRARAQIDDFLAGLGGEFGGGPNSDNFRSFDPDGPVADRREARSAGQYRQGTT